MDCLSQFGPMLSEAVAFDNLVPIFGVRNEIACGQTKIARALKCLFLSLILRSVNYFLLGLGDASKIKDFCARDI